MENSLWEVNILTFFSKQAAKDVLSHRNQPLTAKSCKQTQSPEWLNTWNIYYFSLEAQTKPDYSILLQLHYFFNKYFFNAWPQLDLFRSTLKNAIKYSV